MGGNVRNGDGALRTGFEQALEYGASLFDSLGKGLIELDSCARVLHRAGGGRRRWIFG